MSAMEIGYIVVITLEAFFLVFWLGYNIGKARAEREHQKFIKWLEGKEDKD